MFQIRTIKLKFHPVFARAFERAMIVHDRTTHKDQQHSIRLRSSTACRIQHFISVVIPVFLFPENQNYSRKVAM